jgi:AcrR family transcriptional regulator
VGPQWRDLQFAFLRVTNLKALNHLTFVIPPVPACRGTAVEGSAVHLSRAANPKVLSSIGMARLRSPEKRSAILQAAVHEIAEAGLGAPTAKIARRAGIAAGTLFTYFPNKEELLNELYLELKLEVYTRVNANFPRNGSLERRARHIWSSVLHWAIEFPDKRKVSAQLNLSDLITSETRMRAAAERNTIDAALGELATRGALRGLPPEFATATMAAMQEATMEFVAKQPKHREQLIERAFQVFWRALR